MRKWINSLVNIVLGLWKKAILVVVVVIATISVNFLVSFWLSRTSNIRLPSVGYIRTSGVKAFWGSDLHNETQEIQWGTVYVGTSTNATLYLRSISNINTTLALITENWAFDDSHNNSVSEPVNRASCMYLTWDYDNATVSPGQVIRVTLILSVEANPTFIEFLIQNSVRTFRFDINIHTIEH